MKSYKEFPALKAAGKASVVQAGGKFYLREKEYDAQTGEDLGYRQQELDPLALKHAREIMEADVSGVSAMLTDIEALTPNA